MGGDNGFRGRQQSGGGGERLSQPPPQAPLLGPHLCQQLQQRLARTAATELAQFSEEGTRLGGSWVEKQHGDLDQLISALLPAPTARFAAPPPGVPARPTHPQEPPRAAGRLWGGPTAPHSGSAPRPAAVPVSAAPWGPPGPREHSPQGPCGHPAAPGTWPAPHGSPRARINAGPEAGRPPWGWGHRGQAGAHLG